MADPVPTNAALQILAQLRDLWSKQAKGRKLVAIIALVAVIGVVAWSTLLHHGPEWTVVDDGSSPDALHDLKVSLGAENIPTRMTDGKLEVPSDRADDARAIAAKDGQTHIGAGMEDFRVANLGVSSFGEQVNYHHALEGELARTITALGPINHARVHLTFGKHSVFKDQEIAPTASVQLHVRGGQRLTTEQVRGVRQLVANSVEGLKPEAVTLVDATGPLESGPPTAADRTAEIERGATTRVRALLEQVVGPNKVLVVTTADVDYRKITQTEDLFDKDREATRSETRNIESPNAATQASGVAGTQGNLQGGGGPTAPGAANQKLQETKNYEVSHTVRQTTNPESTLQRLHLAVVVDYKADKDGKPVPRTPAELAELTAIARGAAGIDDARGDKVEVRSMQFVADAEPVAATPVATSATAELPLIPIAIGGGALLLVVAFLVFRRARKRRAAKSGPTSISLALPAPIAELERALEARPSLGTPERPGLPAGRPIQERVLDVVRADVDRTAGLLTAWLSEPAPKGAKS